MTTLIRISFIEQLARSPVFPLLFLYGVILVLYSGSLGNGLIWDDINFFQEQRLQDDPLYLKHAFFGSQAIFHAYYRPLALSLLIAAVRVDETMVFAHALNLLIFALNTTLLTLICRRWLVQLSHPQADVLSLFAGLIYAVHPLQAEPVNWLSGQFDLLMTLFLLLCLYIEASTRGMMQKAFCLSVGFLCAVCCKEAAVIFLPLLGCLHLYRTSLEKSETRLSGLAIYFPIYLGLVVSVLAYLVIRWLALLSLMPMKQGATGLPFHDHLLFVLASVGMYLERMLLPFLDFNPILTFRAHSGLFLLYCAMGAFMLFIPCVLYLRHRKIYAFAVLCFIIVMLPVINILLIPSTLSDISDRYLHFPFAIALLITVTACCGRQPAMQIDNKVVILTLVLVFVFAVSTMRMNKAWQSDAVYWNTVNRYNLDNSSIKMVYLIKLSREGALAQVIVEAQHAYELFHDPLFAILLGEHLIVDNQYGRAKQLLLSLTRQPLTELQTHDILVQLAFIQAENRQLDNAQQLLAQVAALDQVIGTVDSSNEKVITAFIVCRRQGVLSDDARALLNHGDEGNGSLFWQYLLRRLASCQQ